MARTYEYQSDFARKYVAEGKAEGRAEGKAEAVLAVLAARGFLITDDVRVRILACTDADQLEEWIRLAVTAESLDNLFG